MLLLVNLLAPLASQRTEQSVQTPVARPHPQWTPTPQNLPPMARVAAIVTVYQEWAHGDALGTKFFAGTSTDEGYFPPEVEVSPPPPSEWPDGSPPVKQAPRAGGQPLHRPHPGGGRRPERAAEPRLGRGRRGGARRTVRLHALPLHPRSAAGGRERAVRRRRAHHRRGNIAPCRPVLLPPPTPHPARRRQHGDYPWNEKGRHM